MNMIAHREFEPSEEDRALARESRRALAPYVHPAQPLTVFVREGAHEAPIELPAGAVALLLRILEQLTAGRGLVLMPEGAEVTTMEAADLLNVSRPYVIKLLEAGEIKHRKVGRHRRILLTDLLAYKRASLEKSRRLLAELAAEAQQMDPGYRPL